MALHELTKAWQLAYNIDSGTTVTETLHDRWTTLIGFALNPWTVVKTCDGTSVSTSNLLTSPSAWVLGATSSSTRSWGVLQNAVGRQMLIDYYSTDSKEVHVHMSPGGLFTGGTTTAAPTAADEVPCAHASVSDPASFVFNDSGQRYQHIWHSQDGRQTMMLAIGPGPFDQNFGHTFWFIGEMEDAPAAWVNPCVLFAASPASDMIGAYLVGPVTGGHRIACEAVPGAAQAVVLSFTGESINPSSPVNIFYGGSGMAVKNQLSNQWDIGDRLYGAATHESLGGYLGYWPDVYQTMPNQTGYANADGFPGDGSRAWVKWHDLILPWGLAGATAAMLVG